MNVSPSTPADRGPAVQPLRRAVHDALTGPHRVVIVTGATKRLRSTIVADAVEQTSEWIRLTAPTATAVRTALDLIPSGVVFADDVALVDLWDVLAEASRVARNDTQRVIITWRFHPEIAQLAAATSGAHHLGLPHHGAASR